MCIYKFIYQIFDILKNEFFLLHFYQKLGWFAFIFDAQKQKFYHKKFIFQNIKNLVDGFVDNHFLNVSTFTEFCYLENCKSLCDYRVFVWQPFCIVSMATDAPKPFKTILLTYRVTFMRNKAKKYFKLLNAKDIFFLDLTTVSPLNNHLLKNISAFVGKVVINR